MADAKTDLVPHWIGKIKKEEKAHKCFRDQAEAAERTYDLLRTYLCANDPQFQDLLAGRLPDAEELAVPADVQFDADAARDLKQARLEAIGAQYYERFGSLPDDEQLMRDYEHLYEKDSRADASVDGAGVSH